MRTFQKKLSTQKGASITFALLLFLVCAVASAVELLREDFNNKTVKVP